MNKVANEVIINNLPLIAEKIREFYNYCIETENECYRNPKTFTLYALVSNKKQTIKFEIRDVKDTSFNPYNYATERYSISSLSNGTRKGKYSMDENELENYIQRKIEEFKSR